MDAARARFARGVVLGVHQSQVCPALLERLRDMVKPFVMGPRLYFEYKRDDAGVIAMFG